MVAKVTNPSLYGAYAKHRRAVVHWNALCRALIAFSKAHVDMNVTPREGTTQHVEITVTERSTSDIEVIIGDCVQNLRASLDYLVWELAFVARGRPTKERTQFPISTSAESSSRRRETAFVPQFGPHRRFIRKLQPYQGDNPRDHPLARLNRLSNSDKHRLLTFTVSHVRQISARPKEYAGGDVLIFPLFLKETPAMREMLENDPTVHAVGWISFEFDDKERLPVVETLAEIIDYVRLILDWFEPVVR